MKIKCEKCGSKEFRITFPTLEKWYHNYIFDGKTFDEVDEGSFESVEEEILEEMEITCEKCGKVPNADIFETLQKKYLNS